MYYLLYLLWLAITGFWDLITFQSVTSIPQIDLAFRIAVILSLSLMAVTAFKPRWWNIAPCFVVNITAVAAACYLMATRQNTPQYEWGNLAAAGYFTALVQLLSLFILLSVFTLIIFICARTRSQKK